MERAGLPEEFAAKLSRVLAHYGITELDHTDELRGALFRIFLAQQRSASDVHVATSLLRQWAAEPAPQEGRA